MLTEERTKEGNVRRKKQITSRVGGKTGKKLGGRWTNTKNDQRRKTVRGKDKKEAGRREETGEGQNR